MPILFGLDIAALVNDGLQEAGGVLDATLIKVSPGTRTPGDLTGGTNPTTTTHACKGFLESKGERRINGTLVSDGAVLASILGASLPVGVVPTVNDRLTIEGTTYDVKEIAGRDPAAALYVLRVES